MFVLVLFSILQDSLDYIENRNDKGENRFHQEKEK